MSELDEKDVSTKWGRFLGLLLIECCPVLCCGGSEGRQSQSCTRASDSACWGRMKSNDAKLNDEMMIFFCSSGCKC